MQIPELQKLPALTYAPNDVKHQAPSATQILAIAEKGEEPTEDARALLAAHAELLEQLSAREIFTGKAGQLYRLDTLADYPAGVVLVGIGNAAASVSAKLEALESALKKALPPTEAIALNARSWISNHADLPRLVSTLLESFIRQRTFKTVDAPEEPKVKHIHLLDTEYSAKLHALIKEGQAVARAAQLMRYWADLPSNIATPSFLAEQVKAMAKKRKALDVSIWGRKEIEKAGMGAFLAVAQGSAVEPRFLVVRYTGAAEKDAPVALVGKGVTFDSGGISLKPAANMGDMIYDMSGAAAVLATVLAAAEFELKHNVLAVAACCENMPSGTATKPGDIVRSYSGKTIEIQNTDAEGRLLLCDALSWVQEQKPTTIIDVATLTGACVVALGSAYSGAFTRHSTLSATLSQVGSRIGDEIWPMPLGEKYLKLMRSPVADICNLATVRDGGACSAAAFLSFFVEENVQWVHLDVAGTANTGGRDHVSTGRPARLLTAWLYSLD